MSDARLRPLVLSDVDHIMKWVNDDEVVKNFQNFDKTFTREDEESFIKGRLWRTDVKLYAVEAQDTGQYLGNAEINNIPAKNEVGDLSLILGVKEAWGQGYGKSALRALLTIAFNECGLYKVRLQAFADNPKTCHIYTSLGFMQEGIRKEEYKDKEGHRHDMVLFRMFKREYDSLSKGGNL